MEDRRLCLGCMNPKGDEEVCDNCGWQEGTPPESSHYLPPGTVIKERYLLGRVLGQGGFGITYLGWDEVLNTRVAVKEFMPPGIAVRTLGQATVTALKSGEIENLFTYGIERFLDEARTLARFEGYPGIVWVKDVFRANGTAYMVMQYLEGITLNEYRLRKGGSIPYRVARGIMMPVLDTLREVHRGGILHRDISPDNIFVTRGGTVKLLDFGAARFAMGDKSVNYSVILKAGYAPEEQYRSRGRQGEYTDVYSVAATMYQLITGQLPLEALDRMSEDTLLPPSQMGTEIPPAVESALMKALSVRAEQRYQSIAEFQEALLGDAEPGVFEQVDFEADETVPAGLLDDEIMEETPKELDSPTEQISAKTFWSGLNRSNTSLRTPKRLILAASVVLLLGLAAAVYGLAGHNNSKQAGQSADVNNEKVASTADTGVAKNETANTGTAKNETANTETVNTKTANTGEVNIEIDNTRAANTGIVNTGSASNMTVNPEIASTPAVSTQTTSPTAQTYGRLTMDYGAIYEGEIKDGQPNGKGTCTYPGGSKYVGEFSSGEMNGQGTMSWSNGDKYVGAFKNGNKDGQGTMTWSDGRKYVGAWKRDMRDGKGTMTWSNGRRYEGEWKYDGMEGQGTMTWPKGVKYVGEFNSGGLGKGMMTFPPGAGTNRYGDWSGSTIDGLDDWPH